MKIKKMKIPFLFALVVICFANLYKIFFKDILTFEFNNEQIAITCFSATAIAFIISWLLTLKTKDINLYFDFNNKSSGVVGIIAGIAMIFVGAYQLYNYISSMSDNITLYLGIFGIFAGVAFIFMNISFFKGKNILGKYSAITVVPVVWGAIRLLKLFLSNYSKANKLWNVTDEFATIFLLLFLWNLARIFGNIDYSKKYKKVILNGLTAAIFIFTCALGSSYEFYPVDILLALYIIFVLNSVMIEKVTHESEVSKTQVIDENVETKATQNDINVPEDDSKMDMDKVNEIINSIQKEDPVE